MSDPTFQPHLGWAGEPPDLVHLARFPLAGFEPWPMPTEPVERILPFPAAAKQWYWQMRGNCTGASVCQVMSTLNAPGAWIQYDFDALYCCGTATDGVDFTDCARDTGGFLRATLHCAITEGIIIDRGRVMGEQPDGPLLTEGPQEYRWILNDGTAIDQMRASINAGVPVLFGSPWFDLMMHPREIGGEFRIDEMRLPTNGGSPGQNYGGHAYAILGWSDRRDAGFLVNTWGPQWPGRLASGEYALGTWYPAEVMIWIMSQAGYSERAVILDRPSEPLPHPPTPPPPINCQPLGRRCARRDCCADGICTESRSGDRKTCRRTER